MSIKRFLSLALLLTLPAGLGHCGLALADTAKPSQCCSAIDEIRVVKSCGG